MEIQEQQIEKAALLHDMGKICLAVEPEYKTQLQAGVEFLMPYFEKEDTVLQIIKNYCELEEKKAEPSNNDSSYLIYEAGCITNEFIHEDDACEGNGVIDNIRNTVPNQQMDNCSMILDRLKQHFQKKSPAVMEVHELLQSIESAVTYIPFHADSWETTGISLYEHLKLTAAFAVCMYRYFQSNGIADYKNVCCGAQRSKMRNTLMYLFVSGDLSGIQHFVYTVPQNGAIKSLHGRSFYIKLLLETIVDEILSANGLSRSCLLYVGGARFYMLLPNTKETDSFLRQFSQRLNEWFLKYYETSLYLALAWEACTANEFKGSDTVNRIGEICHRMDRLFLQRTRCPYTERQLQELFSPQSRYNKIPAGSRECSVCHMPTPVVQMQAYNDDPDILACPVCRNLLKLGESDLYTDDVFAVVTEPVNGAMVLPGREKDLYLFPVEKEKVDRITIPVKRVYVTSWEYAYATPVVHLWTGNCAIGGRPDNMSGLEDIEKFSENVDGVKRIGVMRADVDDLKALFTAGFPVPHNALFPMMAVSRRLVLFFTQYIHEICAKNINEMDACGCRRFSVFPLKTQGARRVHVVYSGGDKVVIVGVWYDLIELAVDIRRAFTAFTAGKLTLSAGIGLFKSDYPVSQMARAVEKLQEAAKSNERKDSIALFMPSSQNDCSDFQNIDEGRECMFYHWDRFIDDVCGEKLRFLYDHFCFDHALKKDRVYIEKSELYRLMGLLTGYEGGGYINLARFAYALAQLEPKHRPDCRECYEQIRSTLYSWYKNKEDRQELAAAVQLIIGGLG